tara:strand:- start:2332 stop:2562 length:231 start_codon:yes stop_codon:yes gene_type:complete
MKLVIYGSEVITDWTLVGNLCKIFEKKSKDLKLFQKTRIQCQSKDKSAREHSSLEVTMYKTKTTVVFSFKAKYEEI